MKKLLFILIVSLATSCKAQEQYIAKAFTKTIVNNPTWIITNMSISPATGEVIATIIWYDKDSLPTEKELLSNTFNPKKPVADPLLPNTITIWYEKTFDEAEITSAINEAIIAKLKENGLQFQDSDVVNSIDIVK